MILTTFEPNVPGIYRMPAEDYHRAAGVSNSMLGHLNPPARLPAYLATPRSITPAMRLGTLIHQRILEPDLPLPKLAIRPEGMNLTTKEGRAWKEEQIAAGREILGVEEGKALVGCVDAVRRDCSDIFAKGEAELSVFRHYTTLHRDKLILKSRLDWLPTGSNAIVDVKKVAGGKASHREFTRLLIERRYHVQAAYYLDGWNALMGETDRRDCFVFIVVEDEAPFLVARYVVGPELIELGRKQYEADLETYARCWRTGEWPGFGREIQQLTPPEWFLRKVEV